MKKILLISLFTLISFSGLAQVIAVNDGLNSYALCDDGRVIIWGSNYFGTLGIGTTGGESLTPVYVSVLTEVKALGQGDDNCLALKSDGTVWTWGYNYYGQLGLGDNISRSTPTQIPSLTGIVSVSGADNYSFAIKNDGTVWAWGVNYNGVLGDGTTTDRNSPVQVTVMTGIVKIKGSTSHTTALKNDGTVWAWGNNYRGMLGNGSTINSLTPVQVTGLTGIIDITNGYAHSYALKNDGTIWAWGLNYYGQLGTGTADSTGCACDSLPQQVMGITNVRAVTAGAATCFVLKNDSTVWGWGKNDYGEIGDGTFIQRPLPVQVLGLTGITEVTEGNTSYSMALKYDGSLWSWGTGCYTGNADTVGIYNVPLQANYLCTVTAPNTQSISEIQNHHSKITISPNPFNSQTYIMFAEEQRNTTIKITDLLGKEIRTINFTGRQLVLDKGEMHSPEIG